MAPIRRLVLSPKRQRNKRFYSLVSTASTTTLETASEDRLRGCFRFQRSVLFAQDMDCSHTRPVAIDQLPSPVPLDDKPAQPQPYHNQKKGWQAAINLHPNDCQDNKKAEQTVAEIFHDR